jgi:hypothetical protein
MGTTCGEASWARVTSARDWAAPVFESGVRNRSRKAVFMGESPKR